MILVSDTSVLIDLARGGLLEAVFALPHEFAVPDVLYDREMRDEWGERLLALGLQVVEVSEQGVGNALRYRQQLSALSVVDSFALALAKERAWLLLTGDSQLRALAGEENIECHGLLWLLDMIEAAGTPGIQPLHDGLAALAAHAMPVAATRDHDPLGALSGHHKTVVKVAVDVDRECDESGTPQWTLIRRQSWNNLDRLFPIKAMSTRSWTESPKKESNLVSSY